MIQKIKCFFGFHDWLILKKYGDLLGFAIKHPANITERQCLNCKLKDTKIEWQR